MCHVLCDSNALFSLVESYFALDYVVLMKQSKHSADTITDEHSPLILGRIGATHVRNLG